MAFAVRGRAGVVAELFAAPDDADARAALLGGACDRMRADGAQIATTLERPGSPGWRSCRRAGFLPGASYTFEVVQLDAGIPLGELGDPERWTLAGGDFDVV